MKKIYTVLLALMLALPATYAQKGLNVGVNGGSMIPTIINQNSWGVGHEYDYEITFDYFYGFDIGYNFKDNLGLYTGFSRMNFGQDYSDSYGEYTGDADVNWERKLKLKYNIIPIMFKYTGSAQAVNFIGGIGILYAMLSEAEQTWTKEGEDWLGNEEHPNVGATDVTDRFEKNDIILNLEVGARINIVDHLYVDATFNFGYGLKDINASDWQTPDRNGVYAPSHNAYGGFKVGIAYSLFSD